MRLRTMDSAIFILVVVGPFIEELVFRAGMFRLLQKKIGVIQAMVLSSLLFAIVHGNWAQGIPAFIIGMGLALLYFRSDDLRLCYPAHAANNALAVVGMLCPTVGAWGDNWPAVVQVLLGLLLLVAGFAGLMMRGSLFSKHATTHENTQYRFGLPPRGARSHGGCNRHRLPPPVSTARRVDGLLGICGADALVRMVNKVAPKTHGL